MKILTILVTLLCAFGAFADGTIAIQPSSDPPATWQFVGLCVYSNSVPPSAVISLTWLTQSGRDAQLDPELYPRVIVITAAELVSFLGAVSPTGSDAFSGSGAAKRFRQRAAKWLIDNGKIARGANE